MRTTVRQRPLHSGRPCTATRAPINGNFRQNSVRRCTSAAIIAAVCDAATHTPSLPPCCRHQRGTLLTARCCRSDAHSVAQDQRRCTRSVTTRKRRTVLCPEQHDLLWRHRLSAPAQNLCVQEVACDHETRCNAHCRQGQFMSTQAGWRRAVREHTHSVRRTRSDGPIGAFASQTERESVHDRPT